MIYICFFLFFFLGGENGMCDYQELIKFRWQKNEKIRNSTHPNPCTGESAQVPNAMAHSTGMGHL